MYTNQTKNQALETNKVLPGRNISLCAEDYRVKLDKNFINNPLEVINGLKGFGSSLFFYYFSFRDSDFITIRNSVVAAKVGCDIRTVKRWTKKFHQMGILTKSQRHYYAVNDYEFHMPNSVSFKIWFNTLPLDEQEFYSKHRMTPRQCNPTPNIPKKEASKKGVTLIKSYIKFNIYNPISHITSEHAHAKSLSFVGEKDGISPNGISNEAKKEKLAMLSLIQKQWILRNDKHPDIKDIIMSPKVKPHLITPLVESITAMLKLDQREQFKLLAFPDDSLGYAYGKAKELIAGRISLRKPIEDRMGWFMGMLTKFCKTKGISPDWRWYFQICEIMGIEAIKHGEKRKILTAAPKLSLRTGHSPMEEVKVLSRVQEIEQIKKSIAAYEDQIKFPEKYFVTNRLFTVDEYAQQTKTYLARAIKDLEGLDEFYSQKNIH